MGSKLNALALSTALATGCADVGDSGEYSDDLTPAVVELGQPYNCNARFGSDTGALIAFQGQTEFVDDEGRARVCAIDITDQSSLVGPYDIENALKTNLSWVHHPQIPIYPGATLSPLPETPSKLTHDQCMVALGYFDQPEDPEHFHTLCEIPGINLESAPRPYPLIDLPNCWVKVKYDINNCLVGAIAEDYPDDIPPVLEPFAEDPNDTNDVCRDDNPNWVEECI